MHDIEHAHSVVHAARQAALPKNAALLAAQG